MARLQDEVTLCKQRIASYDDEILQSTSTIERHEKFRARASAVGLEWKRKTCDYLKKERGNIFLHRARCGGRAQQA